MPEAALAGQLPASDQAARLPLHHLEIVVEEPDGTGPKGGEHRHHHEAIGERGPEEGWHDGRKDDDEAAHGRRAPLHLVIRQKPGSNHLPDLEGMQLRDGFPRL